MDRIVEKRSSEVPKQPKMTRVAAYARVSSGKDAMMHSLSAQISYYSGMIQSHPGWMYCGVYSDEAKTGTKDSREGFQRLLSDCRAGIVDLVITKSISRFARNTVTLLQTVRELKELGIDVYFEEQNLHTVGPDGELLITILAAYAQEESLSVSENQKWRVRKNFEEGRPWNCTMLGYRNADGTLTVAPDEAAVVRRVFSMFLDGAGTWTIANGLNAEGIRTRYGNRFHRTAIQTILRNYAYTGNLLLQTTFREDAITKKDRDNTGELPMYHALGTHEAIISLEDFNRAQEELARRKETYTAPSSTCSVFPFTSLITCAKCGKKYQRKIRKTGVSWICSTYNHEGKAACPSKQIPEKTLYSLTENMDLGRVTEIVADDGNRLSFHFSDGTVVEKVWRDRSRAESWTPEMRERAREQSIARCKK